MQTCRNVVRSLSLASLLCAPAWSGCLTPAGASGSNPNSRYIIGSTKQEVYDTVTGITWQRCPYGWFVGPDGKSCLKLQGSGDGWSQRYDGVAIHYFEYDLATHRYGPPELYREGWTIPSGKYLKTLVDQICKNPTINQEVFPSTPPAPFWTSDEKGTNSHGHDFYYLVNFADGSSDDHEDYHKYQIRLMRRGKTPSIVAAEEQNVASPQQ